MKMWRLISAVTRKRSKVADSNMFEEGNGVEVEVQIFGHERERRQHGWARFSVIHSILNVPISILSCVSHPQVNGSDGVWVSGEFSHISEINHLMVSDSMRYAILM
ncbi:hypothetical protein Lal_00036027 [Lupinus albus]|uniref:Uncharacterized protein n=1 Tax=Lupinus albus TaxID=3870 RepID=A0A6A4QLM3_LUPAL|nr:hypothetical protein Lalb_Chr04g0249481 [Lupinus albus]KAF1868589.1 hypothetical protein Lal_00036027 [Lupinus albus]